jgi:ribose transport system ATP-binding protein
VSTSVQAQARTVLEARGITKSFPGVRALRDVSLRVEQGEVLGLVGENGAGKSTLLSILSGSMAPDSGEVVVAGQPQHLTSYTRANMVGIFRAQQDQGLVPNLTVAENLYIGHEAHFTVAGVLQPGRMNRTAEAVLSHDQILRGRVQSRDRVSTLPLDVRQLVEIARGFAVADLLGIAKPVVLLDETTASLNHDEVTELYAHIRSRRSTASFLFVSHRLHEILELCDRVYVLKDGRLVAERLVSETSEDELHRLMVGRERESNQYLDELRTDNYGPEALRVEHLTREPFFRDIGLYVRRGEILGLGGIAGCGKSHVARAIAGDLHCEGTIAVDGITLRRANTSSRVGLVAYGPLDRHSEGVSLLQSIRWNITWSSLRRYSARGFLRVRKEKAAVNESIKRYGIVTPSREAMVGKLSGGNQQKVMLARLVESGARVLVLDNPTRGVDVGARQEIYAQLRRLVSEGIALVVISDDMNELLGLTDRLAVMRDGQLICEWTHEETLQLDEETVVARMV